jgi:hypothetical protein
MFSCFDDFTAKFQVWTRLDWIVLSLAKRWQIYLSSDGETYAVYVGAGSLQAHHHCRYCCCCYCLLLSCHLTLASHPEDLLAPEQTPWMSVTEQISSKILSNIAIPHQQWISICIQVCQLWYIVLLYVFMVLHLCTQRKTSGFCTKQSTFARCKVVMTPEGLPHYQCH